MYSNPEMQQKEDYLRYILRRHPEQLKLHMSKEGWVDTKALLNRSLPDGYNLTMADIHEIMRETVSEYSFKDGEKFIRANYGHSLNLKLTDLVGRPSIPKVPFLFHGTSRHNVRSIETQGILPGARDHLFLTSHNKAKQYALFHDAPVIVTINVRKCTEQRCELYNCQNTDIWLTYFVPKNCIEAWQSI